MVEPINKLNKQEIRIIVIVSLLILVAFACNLVNNNYLLSLAMGYFRNLIFIGLTFAWGFSVQKRMTQKTARKYLLLIAGMILFWFVERTCKYFFIIEMPTVTRYLWYLFYVPIALVPVFGIFVAASMGEPENYKPSQKMYLLYLPALVVIAAVLTNDLHQQVFSFPNNILTDGNGKNAYTYGPLYFAVTAIIIIEVMAFLLVLLNKNRIPGKHKRMLLPIGVLVLAVLYGCAYITEVPLIRSFVNDFTAVSCLLMIATFESCVRIGLIHSNSHYDELFDIATVGAQITDKEYKTVLSSETARALPLNILKQAEKKPVMLDDGFRLSGQSIHGGHTFWLEDVSDIVNAISELKDINDTLEDSNAAKREENNTLKQKTRLKELNRMYNKMQLETAAQIEKLQQRLVQLAKTENKDEEKYLIGRIMVLGAYIKRRNNLLCIMENQDTTQALDLNYCFNESIEALQLQNIESSYSVLLDGDLDVKVIMKLYDAFEMVLEKTIESLKRLNILVKKENSEYLLMLELDTNGITPTLPLQGFDYEDEGNGEWLLSFTVYAKEGEA